MAWSRRRFVSVTSALSLFGISSVTQRSWAQSAAPAPGSVADAFPSLDPALAREAVTTAHNNLPRLRELVERQPTLARASIDWGFGDWEACIDAAAHVGNKPIADFLLTHGARPTIFSAAMMGHLDVVKAFVAARPGIQRTHGPHGLTLLSHAKAGGADAAAVVQYLAGLGDADTPTPTQPLEPGDRDAVVGQYIYGDGPRASLVIDVQQDRLGIQRLGASRRTLFHSGNLIFFPTGAPSVKIAFARQGGRVTQLTVADPDVVITAKRA